MKVKSFDTYIINCVVEMVKLGPHGELHFPVNKVEGINYYGGGEDGGGNEGPDKLREGLQRLEEGAGYCRLPRHHDRLLGTGIHCIECQVYHSNLFCRVYLMKCE